MHRAAVTAREEAVQSREAAITEKETQLASLLQLKDAEITALQQLISSADERHRHVVEARIRDAVSQREDELRASVVRHQQEVSAAMAKREEELMEAVKRREEELRVAWIQREQEIRDEMSTAVEERMEWVRKQMEEVEEGRRRLDATRAEVEGKVKITSDGTIVEKTGMGFHLSRMKTVSHRHRSRWKEGEDISGRGQERSRPIVTVSSTVIGGSAIQTTCQHAYKTHG